MEEEEDRGRTDVARNEREREREDSGIGERRSREGERGQRGERERSSRPSSWMACCTCASTCTWVGECLCAGTRACWGASRPCRGARGTGVGLSLPAIRVVPLTIRAYHSTRACTERITTITLADLAHFARTPSYICRFSLSVFSFLFSLRIFVFFLFFFFTILKSRTCIFFRSFEYFEFSELFICLDQFPNISTVCRFK